MGLWLKVRKLLNLLSLEESLHEVNVEKVAPAIYGLVDVVRWTSIPVKLKVLKLFIRELSNIAEGKEEVNNGNENGNGGGEVLGGGVIEDGGDGWESDEDDDDWEDLKDTGLGNEIDDPEVQEDILKGINTEVLVTFCSGLNCRRLLLNF